MVKIFVEGGDVFGLPTGNRKSVFEYTIIIVVIVSTA